MGRYFHLWTDFGFQKVFGEESNKDLLISFLNTLLPAKHQIATLEFSRKFSRNACLGVSMPDRKAIFDLHCKTPDGSCFLVELQKAKQNFFKDRSLYYASFPMLEKGLELGRKERRVEGIEQGRQKQSVAVLQMLLRQRFGAIPDEVLAAMEKAEIGQLEMWIQRVLTAQQLGEVIACLFPSDGSRPT